MNRIVISFWLLVLPLYIYAQESTVASGGNGTGEGGSVSYSLGQVSYSSNSGSNGSITEGVQQPYDVSVIFFIEKRIQQSHAMCFQILQVI